MAIKEIYEEELRKIRHDLQNEAGMVPVEGMACSGYGGSNSM